ncbi:UDP-glucose 4-epimerase [Candidatus Gottesmanbacteria bacterium RIFCSPHIGHO2_01_FULL_39_10]|uniref:UDP-glucose 4-epimerase n=1 Tax=Candidatus Gottesmanbacteria bacterium RIFCSPHIGHO2_01_FULL_39_10 TaxID=1798375 RepID=A0A1F5ZPJ2_9BACT|nr:MAG: UDP-glucose 4-epimerase [Candidatus Gottesmanbacteria bacterium RIFCSPHIGHO2_01_FULL_39_10]
MIKSVLVTGGAGYVGAVLVPKLLKKGYKVKVVDWYIYNREVFDDHKKNKNLKEIKGDIRDRKLLGKELRGVDAVIHLACISNDPSFELDPKLGKSINYDATVLIGDLSKKLGVRRLIYASSSSVYGVKKEKNVHENLSLAPLTDYSKYKVLSEKYLLSKQGHDFNVLILRPSTVCGYSPRLRLDLTVNILTIQALVNKKMTVFGGSQMRPNIHIEDMADLYVKTLEYKDAAIAGKVFNAGYDNYSVLDIAKRIKKTLRDKSIEIKIVPSSDNRSYHVSSGRIAKELGFRARHSVEEAIGDLARAYKKGMIPEALTNKQYYNIKTMQALGTI